MSIPALVLLALGALVYLGFGFCLALLVSFGDVPSNRFLRAALRLGLLFAWPLAYPAVFVAAFFVWVFS